MRQQRQWLGQQVEKSAFVLCGDFNAMPGSMVYDRVCEKLKDSQASLPGQHPYGTWFGRYPISQIDHVFINSFLKVKSVFVPRTSLDKLASDHLPLVVDIFFKD